MNSGKAKLVVTFLWILRSFLRMNLMTSIKVKPAVIETEVTTLGIIFPAWIKTFSLSAGSIR